MNYTFPVINNISDLENNLLNETVYHKVVKGGYTSFMYNSLDPNTFPPIKNESDKFIRECRGIAFDNETGDIIARPFHKFFNYKQVEETEEIDFNQSFEFLEKLDGSMIFPLYLSTGTRLATKRGVTDVSMLAENFVATDKGFWEFVDYCKEKGLTPIFEFCSRDNKIVIDYPETKIVLLDIREMSSGNYVFYEHMFAAMAKVEIVQVMFDSTEEFDEVEKIVRDLKDSEGIVLTYNDGHRVKIKAEHYVKLHRYVNITSSARHLIHAFYSENWDDVYANMEDEVKTKINSALNYYDHYFDMYVKEMHQYLEQFDNYKNRIGEPTREERKEFAAEIVPDVNLGAMKKIAFKAFNGETNIQRYDIIRSELHKYAASCSSKNSSWDDFEQVVLHGVDVLYEEKKLEAA